MKKIIHTAMVINLMILPGLLFTQPDHFVYNRLQRINKNLDLNQEQQEQLRKIFEYNQKELRRILDLNEGNIEAQQNAVHAQMEILNQQLKNVMTAEQFEKYTHLNTNNYFSRQTQELQKILHLSDSQAEEVDDIILATHEKMDALRENSFGDRHQMRGEMIQLMEEQNRNLERLLNADQKNQYEEFKKERQDRMHREGPPDVGRARVQY